MRRGFFWLSLGVFLIAAAPVAAQPASQSGGAVTCALVADPALGLPDSAAVALLTAELSKQPGLALLERAEVGKVLQERSLQLALAAEGVEARRALGTLLKARLLVLLRAGERTVGTRNIRHIDLAISETASGLRLVQDALPWDEAAPGALAPPVLADVRLALARLAQPTRAIVAVPPFLSDDLERRYDALQDAYARLLTGSLANRPGLRLVELAEARALADEIRLTGGDKIGRELLPYYFQGRYRNQSRDGRTSPTVALTLELRRGEQALGQKKSAPLAPEAAAAFLRQGAEELLEPVLKSTPLPFDPAQEVAELLRQAHRFGPIGEYEKALTLTEAALLLQPTMREALRYAIDLTTDQLNELDATLHRDPTPPGARYDAAIERAIALDLRALDHLELYVRRCGFDIYEPLYWDLVAKGWLYNDDKRMFLQAGRRAFMTKVQDSRLGPMINELGLAKREVLTAYAEYAAAHPQIRSGRFLEALLDMEICPGQSLAIREPAAAARMALMRLVRLDAINEIRHHPKVDANGNTILINDYVMYNDIIKLVSTVVFPDPREAEAFLAEIAAVPDRPYAILANYIRVMREPLEPAMRLIRLWQLYRSSDDHNIHNALDSILLSYYEMLRDERNKERQAAAQALAERAFATPPAPGDDPSQDPLRSIYTKPSGGKLPAAAAGQGSGATTATLGDDYALAPIRNAELAGQKLLGWIEARDGYDLIWSDQCLYALNPAGQLKLLFFLNPPRNRPYLPPPPGGGPGGGEGPLEDVVFDGRWAWAALKDRLVVIDPERGTLAQIDARNGLPPGELAVAPLGPGRVCVAGGFGRAWCANITYEEPGFARIDVFHEARLMRGHWDDPNVAFRPRFAAAFTGADGRPRVLVGRAMEGRGQYLPLLVDPGRRTVEVVPQRLSSRLRGADITQVGGSLWWISQTDEIVHDDVHPYYSSYFCADHDSVPCVRLEGWSGSAGRPQIIFNNIPGPKVQAKSVTLGWEYAPYMAEVRQGRTFIFGRECWELDRANGRLIQLRGPGLKKLGHWRLGHSSRFGTVLIGPGPQGTCAYAFQPGAAPSAAGRQVVQPDPLEGTEVVLRRLPIGTAMAYTTLTTQIRSRQVVFEPEETTTSTMLVMLGQDQPVPWVREVLADRITLFGGMVVAKFLMDSPYKDERGLHDFEFSREAGYRAVPRTWLFTDARGQALAGARVRLIYHFVDHSVMNPATVGKLRFDSPLELPGGLTDATGRLNLVVPNVSYGSPNGTLGYFEFQASHPDCGTAICPMVWPGSVLGGGARTMDAGGDLLARTPLVRRGSAESRRALRGRLVDAQGRGLGGRLVTAFLKESMAESGWPTLEHMEHPPAGILSQADGSFLLYPVSDSPSPPELPAGTPLRVRVCDPQHFENPLRDVWLDSAREQTIALPAPTGTTATLAVTPPAAPRRGVATAGAPADSSTRASATTPLRMPPLAEPPAALVAYAPSVAPAAAGRPTPTPTPTPIPAAPARSYALDLDDDALAEERWEGQVVDGLSGAPLVGVYVILSDHVPPFPHFMASQWRMLQDYPGPLTGESEVLTLLRVAAGNMGAQITRTDAAGHYVLRPNHWDWFYRIYALQQNYVLGTMNGQDSDVNVARSGGGRIISPLLLYPAGGAARPARPSGAAAIRELAQRSDRWIRGDRSRADTTVLSFDAFVPNASSALLRITAPKAPRPAWVARRTAPPTAATAASGSLRVNDPDLQLAEEFYAARNWVPCRAAFARYAAAHPDAPRLPEVRIKSILCLYEMQHYEAFQLEALNYMDAHPAMDGPLFRALAWHLVLGSLARKQPSMALLDCNNYLIAFPDGEDALPAMRQRALLALEIAEGFTVLLDKTGNTVGSIKKGPIPFYRLGGDAGRLAAQGRSWLRDYVKRLKAARQGAAAGKKQELDALLAEAAALEKKHAALFEINWQVIPRLNRLIGAPWFKYLLLAGLAGLIATRQACRRRRKGQ